MRSPITSSNSDVAPVKGRIWAAAQKTLGSRSPTQSTRSEKLRSASNCHSDTSNFSQWWSPSERSVCSEMISDMDGMPQPYGGIQLHSDGQPPDPPPSSLARRLSLNVKHPTYSVSELGTPQGCCRPRTFTARAPAVGEASHRSWCRITRAHMTMTSRGGLGG